MSQKRKRLSGAEKIAIVKRYLVERVPISDLCDQHGVQPSRERAPEPWSSIREQVLMRHSEEPISPLRQPVDGDRVASVWRRLDRGVPLGGRCEPPRDATASRCPDASHGSPYRQRGVCRECL